MTGVGNRAAAAWISAREGVSTTPIVPTTPHSAPSQCDTSIISGPEMPGNRYLAPPAT